MRFMLILRRSFFVLQHSTNLDIRLNKFFPTVLLRIMHPVLPVYPADIWAGFINQAVPVSITVVPTSPVPPIQIPGLLRQIYIAATKPTLRTGKRW